MDYLLPIHHFHCMQWKSTVMDVTFARNRPWLYSYNYLYFAYCPVYCLACSTPNARMHNYTSDYIISLIRNGSCDLSCPHDTILTLLAIFILLVICDFVLSTLLECTIFFPLTEIFLYFPSCRAGCHHFELPRFSSFLSLASYVRHFYNLVKCSACARGRRCSLVVLCLFCCARRRIVLMVHVLIVRVS